MGPKETLNSNIYNTSGNPLFPMEIAGLHRYQYPTYTIHMDCEMLTVDFNVLFF